MSTFLDLMLHLNSIPVLKYLADISTWITYVILTSEYEATNLNHFKCFQPSLKLVLFSPTPIFRRTEYFRPLTRLSKNIYVHTVGTDHSVVVARGKGGEEA